MKRDFGDKHYREWRKSVLKRDKCRCQMPGCKKRTKLEVHHIQTWASAIYLRYEVSNGITLCRQCHSSIKNKERFFISLFMSIISENENK